MYFLHGRHHEDCAYIPGNFEYEDKHFLIVKIVCLLHLQTVFQQSDYYIFLPGLQLAFIGNIILLFHINSANSSNMYLILYNFE